MGRHVLGHHQTHHVSKAPLPHAGLDAFEQIFGFQFLDGHVGVAGDVKGMRLQHLHPRKQRAQMSGDHLLQPHEFEMGLRSPAVLLGRRGAVDRDQRRQRIGNLDAREALVALAVADERGQVQAEVGNVREGPARIEGQRSQNGKRRRGEIIAGDASLDLI